MRFFLRLLFFSIGSLIQPINAFQSAEISPSLLAFADHFSKEPSAKALALFPQTIQEIEIFTTQAIETFRKDQLAFIENSKNSLTYDGIVSSLDQMLQIFYWKKTTLVFLSLTTSDPLLLDKAAQEVKRFDAASNAFENNPILSDICIAYAYKALSAQLTPSQNYLLIKLLKSLPPNQFPEELYQALSKNPMEAWTYVKGESSERLLEKKISILNWNVCFFDQGLSMIFGGVLPWQDRLSRICDLLKKQNSDIICLQEIFSREAAEKLYHQLKDTYAHFYVNIGPIQYGFNQQTYGVSSGLFVASKYPLDSVAFTPYNTNESPPYRWYGFFSAKLNGSFPIRIVTTHLHPGSSSEDLSYRARQIKAIDASIQDKIPTFICGDFNIERMSTEYTASLLPYFINFYDNSQWTCLELRDYWWKAKQNADLFYSKYQSPEWIDYFLQSRKTLPSGSIKSSPILVNDPHDPAAALSDHQAILTSITLN
jgi:endonuclease/exonuclease/phosphatase family metal-dependent hydrolase